MRLLLNESVPRRFQRALPGHHVRTVVDLGWSGKNNGKRLAFAANDFDAFLTAAKNLPYQQNPNALPIAVIILDLLANALSALLALVQALERALVPLDARTCARVALGT